MNINRLTHRNGCVTVRLPLKASTITLTTFEMPKTKTQTQNKNFLGAVDEKNFNLIFSYYFFSSCSHSPNNF